MNVLIQKISEKRANATIKVGYWVYGEPEGDPELGICYSAFRFANSAGKTNLGIFDTSPVIAIKNIDSKQTEIETRNSTYLITELTEVEDYRVYIKKF